MSTISVTFLIQNEDASNTESLCFSLLKEKSIATSIEPRDDSLSYITTIGNYNEIMEFFYILKDVLIRKVEGIMDIRSEESFERYTLGVYLPESFIPAIIGKNGNAIEKLRQFIYANVTIPSDKLYESKAEIVLEGDKRGIVQAFDILMKRVQTLNPRLSWVYDNSHRMSNITDTIINADKTKKSESYTKALFTVLNPSMSILSSEDTELAREKENTAEDSLTFSIPNKKVGSIIGTKGETISSIRRETQTQIVISKMVEHKPDRRVTITGNTDNVCKAWNLIKVHLNES